MGWFTRLHVRSYRLTRGILGGNLVVARILLLTTMGRKSGLARTTPLRYLRHDDAYMVAASNWGKTSHPAWYYNLSANPDVEIQIMGRHMRASAEIISQGEERDRLYQRFVEADKRFEQYPKTAGGRSIPIVIFRPQR